MCFVVAFVFLFLLSWSFYHLGSLPCCMLLDLFPLCVRILFCLMVYCKCCVIAYLALVKLMFRFYFLANTHSLSSALARLIERRWVSPPFHPKTLSQAMLGYISHSHTTSNTLPWFTSFLVRKNREALCLSVDLASKATSASFLSVSVSFIDAILLLHSH